MNRVKELLTMLDYYKTVQPDEDKVSEIESELNNIKLDAVKQLRQKKSNRISTSSYVPYPDYEDENFFAKLLAKKEFKKYVSESPSGDVDTIMQDKCGQNRKFSLTANQRFLKNFIHPSTPYQSLLLYHSVGVGKSLSAIGIAEQFINYYDKKVIVIMPGNLKENFKRQIFDLNQLDQPVSKKYYNLAYEANLADEAIEKKASKLIRSNYEFYGFQEFANLILNKEKSFKDKRQNRFDAKLKELFSNCVFIIDEVHNVRVGDNIDKRVPPVLLRVLKNAENSKLILLTATPMFNDATEIIWLLNLMLANDKKSPIADDMVFDKNGNILDGGLEYLKKKATGYISYMDGGNPFTFPIKLYPSIDSKIKILDKKHVPKKEPDNTLIPLDKRLSRLELVPSVMSTIQKKVYDAAITKVGKVLDNDNEDENDEEDNENEKSEKTGIATISQISNIVFPIQDTSQFKECSGTRGFANSFETVIKDGTLQLKYKESAKTIAGGEFLNQKLLGKYCPKIKQILDIIKNSKGIVFIYSFYLSSGIVPLALALEHLGFAKYGTPNLLKTASSPFKINGVQQKYAIISPRKEYTPDFDEAIRTIRSEANKNGELIKVILGSSVAAEGLDFKNIREVHFLEPWYHINKMDQIIGRAYRNCSHVILPKEQRNFTVYHHINKLSLETDVESIDERIYRFAENKQYNIDRIESALKEVSIDCILNKPLFTFDESLTVDIETSQGTLVKQFKLGKLQNNQNKSNKCQLSKLPSKTDTSTFGMQFMSYEIEEIVDKLKEIFKSNSVLTYLQILQRVGGKETDTLNNALQTLLDDRTIFKNKNEIDGFIIFRNNKYMFQPLSVTDLRIPLEDRIDYVPKTRTVISIEPPQNNKMDVIASVKKSSSKTKINKDIIEKLRIDVDEMDSLCRFEGNLDQCIWDYFVDRLSSFELLEICSLLLKDKGKQITPYGRLLCNSLERGHILHKNPKDNQYKYVLDVVEDELYIVENDKLEKANPVDINRFKILPSAMVQKPHVKSIKSYVEAKKDRAGNFKVNFKMIDETKENSTGFVCVNTSTLKINHLHDFIKGIEPKQKVKTKTDGKNFNKMLLCQVYEILSRSVEPKIFARLYEAKKLFGEVKF